MTGLRRNLASRTAASDPLRQPADLGSTAQADPPWPFSLRAANGSSRPHSRHSVLRGIRSGWVETFHRSPPWGATPTHLSQTRPS